MAGHACSAEDETPQSDDDGARAVAADFLPPPSPPAPALPWQQLAQQSAFRPHRLAELCRISLRHLERRFKVEMGTTPRRWLKLERLRCALGQLRGNESIKQVAYGLGYCQFSQFCREFKLAYGITPGQFRRLDWPAQEHLIGSPPREPLGPPAIYRYTSAGPV